MWFSTFNLAQRFTSLDRNLRDASVLLVLRVLIYLTITSQLYIFFNGGDYTPIKLTDYQAMIIFLLSGRSLYCIGLFLIVWQLFDVGIYKLWRFIFFRLYLLLIPVVKKVFLKNTLIYNKIIIKDYKNMRVTKGPRYTEYTKAIKLIVQRSKEEYKAQLFDSFIVSVLLYIIYILKVRATIPHAMYTNWIFSIALLFSLYFHIHNYCLFRYAKENADDMLKKLKKYEVPKSNIHLLAETTVK